MKKRITLFSSRNKNRDSLNAYCCCIHCTGTYSDLKNVSEYFQAIFKRKNGENRDMLYLDDKDDLKQFNKLILLLKNTLSFHINVKDNTYYSFIYFWNNVLFKDFRLKEEFLWYKMINDVYSNINKNDFRLFIEPYLTLRKFYNTKENLPQKTIENICNQIKISNSCTSDIKKYIESFLPVTYDLSAYIHKQLDVSSFKNIELKHIINYHQKEYIILVENDMTDKIYIDEHDSYFPFFKGLTTKCLDLEPVESCLKDFITMLDFLRDIFLYVFQRLEQTTIDKNERKKFFNILFALFQLTEIDNLELEIDDKTFGILQDFIKSN